jgi:MFS family permease
VRVIGPTLAAGIIAITAPGPAFGVQAVCFLIAARVVFGLALPPVARPPRATSTIAAMRQEILDGLRIVWRTPVVRGLAAAESLWQLVFASLVVTLLIYIEESLRPGDRAATIYSLMMAAFAAGAAAGALIARPVELRIGRPRLMAIGYLAPLTLMPALLTPPLPVLFACWLALGFTDSWAVIAMQTYLAEAVPDAMRGRVYATWFGAVTLSGAIAFVIIGWLTPRLGPPQTLALVGGLVGVGGPLLLLATGAVASLRRGDSAA